METKDALQPPSETMAPMGMPGQVGEGLGVALEAQLLQPGGQVDHLLGHPHAAVGAGGARGEGERERAARTCAAILFKVASGRRARPRTNHESGAKEGRGQPPAAAGPPPRGPAASTPSALPSAATEPGTSPGAPALVRAGSPRSPGARPARRDGPAGLERAPPGRVGLEAQELDRHGHLRRRRRAARASAATSRAGSRARSSSASARTASSSSGAAQRSDGRVGDLLRARAAWPPPAGRGTGGGSPGRAPPRRPASRRRAAPRAGRVK